MRAQCRVATLRCKLQSGGDGPKTKRRTQTLAASVRDGQAQRAEARERFGGHEEKLRLGSLSRRSVKN